MIPENPPPKQYRFSPNEGYESRSQRRLQEDLGIDEASVEAIMHLRSQVIELQAQIRQLETELSTHLAGRNMRLARYRADYYEATWIELEFQE